MNYNTELAAGMLSEVPKEIRMTLTEASSQQAIPYCSVFIKRQGLGMVLSTYVFCTNNGVKCVYVG